MLCFDLVFLGAGAAADFLVAGAGARVGAGSSSGIGSGCTVFIFLDFRVK